MKKITELTKQQQDLIPVVRDEWIKYALGGDSSVDEVKLKVWLEFVYGLIKAKAPKFEIVGGPLEAQKRANALNGNEEMEYYPSGIGIGYDSGWTAYYDYFTRIGVLKDDKFARWKEFRETGVWDCLLFENIAYVIRRPSLVLKDERGRLHCENGPSVMFPNGEKFYSWHGARVPERLIMNSSDATKEDLLAEKNSEVVRAWGEKLGWGKFLDLIGAVLLDEHKDITGLTYGLYDLKVRPSPEFARFLKMESPELNDGTRPFYVEPVHPELETAMAARKWKCAIDVNGNRPTPEECNKDPELRFLTEA